MITKSILIVLLFLMLVIESTFIAYPFVLVVSLFAITVFRSNRILIAIFTLTLLLDIVRVIPLGTTTLFVFAFALLSSFYQRSLHAADVLIFAGVIFVISIVYSIVTFYSVNIFLSIAVFASILAVLSWAYSTRGVLTERNLS